jgi:lipid-A-disaccharide synthase
MTDPVRLFIVAGEPSGDRIGADLVRRVRVNRQVQVSGVGGDALEGEGLQPLFPMSDLSVMGLTDVLVRLPWLYLRMRQTVDAIKAAAPDLVVLIDSQVFSQTVAQQLRKAGYNGQILLYVAPSVWAWRPERAVTIKPLYDEVLAVLPFEPAVMERLGGPPTTYVGHPALQSTSLRKKQPERGPMLLLPGSRRGELRRHLQIMRNVAHAFRRHERVTDFVLPTPKHTEEFVHEAVRSWDIPVYVTSTQQGKRAAFIESVAAAAVSGTVTLELALAGIPTVATYVGERAQARHWKKYKGKYATLPNILVQDRLIPEILGLKPQSAEVIAEMERLLDDPSAMERQREGFARIRAGMEKGAPDAPLTDAADRVLAHLGQERAATGT